MLENGQKSFSLEKCRSCNSSSVKLHSSRSKFPLYIWPLKENESTDLEDIQIYICLDCGYIQLQDITAEQISEIYRDEAFNLENPGQNNERLLLLTKENTNRFKEKKVLEIGGGRNTFLHSLPNNTKKWVADFSVDNDVKREVEGFFEGDFLDLEIDERNFDYIFMFHVLEHFNDPSSAIKKAKNLLNDQGKIIVEVPNFSYESINRPDYTFFHMHISLFTQASLLSFMSRQGLSGSKFIKANDVLFAEFGQEDDLSIGSHLDDSLSYLSIVENNISKCSSELKKVFKQLTDQKVAIFGGGGASTLFLYNYPFLFDHVGFALDNDSKKIGRSLGNGKIPIVSPNRINDLNISNVIVLDKKHIDYINNKKVNYITISDIYDS
jgi:2-polyprenyl-3-methyl-5-hydroxy-6-metoxy-1,4-benzoquinol methylase